MVVRLL